MQRKPDCVTKGDSAASKHYWKEADSHVLEDIYKEDNITKSNGDDNNTSTADTVANIKCNKAPNKKPPSTNQLWARLY